MKARRGRLDRSLWLALVLTAAVVVPRAVLTMSWHCESTDDEYHLVRGMMFWHRAIPSDLDLNDPPLGEAIVAAPLLLIPQRERVAGSEIFGRALSPESVLKILAAWKAMLFLPGAAAVFLWCRRLYGLRGAWLALGMLIVEPTFAAHIPVAALDVLGVEAIVIACFLAWRYFERPTWGRLIAAAVATAFAMAVKHTAIALPGVILLWAILWWVVRPMRCGEPVLRDVPRRAGAVVVALVVGMFSMWALMGFDVSRSAHPTWPEGATPRGESLMYRTLPAGLYIRSVMFGMSHNAVGHQNYLLGVRRAEGWWYYFPFVATYKVPIGIALVLALGMASLFRRRVTFDELGLIVPMLCFALLAMWQSVNIGFRHFLPAYVFGLMLSARCVQAGGWKWTAAAWLAVIAAAVHVAMFHPDYIAYVNFPREREYLQISDSNIDWGQGIPQARRWLEEHQPRKGKPVAIETFGGQTAKSRKVEYYMRGTGATPANGELPARGLLIISKVQVAGPYDRKKSFWPLRTIDPVAEIGETMLVYDIDALRASGKLPAVGERIRRVPRTTTTTSSTNPAG